MKKKILLSFLAMILVSSLFIPFILSIPVRVTPPNFDVFNDGIQVKDRNTYSNYSKMFWVFGYFGDLRVEGPVTGHAYSVDGINWNIVDDSFESLNVWHNTVSTHDWDFYFEPNGRYFWVAWKYTHSSPDILYIARGEMHINGSISFPEGRQFVVDIYEVNKHFEGRPSIASDSNGCPFVAYTMHMGGNDYFAYIQKSSTNDGTWNSEGVQYFQMAPYEKTYQAYVHKVCRLKNGRMSWTIMGETINERWFVDTNHYSGSSWLSTNRRLLWDTLATPIDAYKRVDITSYGDITVAAYSWRNDGTMRLSSKVLNYNDGWENGTTLLDMAGTEYALTPSITVNENGTIYVFLFQDDNSYFVNYTRRFSNYTWEGTWHTFYDDADNVYEHHRFHTHESYKEYITFWFHDGINGGADLGDDEMFHDYIGEFINPVMEHLNTTLYNQDGTVNDGWIFEGEVYDLVSYVDNASRFFVNTTDSRHDIRFQWNNETEQMWISVDPADQFTIGLPWSNYTRIGNVTRLQWRFIPDRSIIDCENASWGYYIENDYYGVNATGILGFETNIYNLGGFTYYTFQGDGGRTIGGHPWELYATNGTEGSSARAEQIYRKLQHVHFLIEIDMDNEWDSQGGEFDITPGVGFVDIGIDYRINGTWVEGFYVRLYVQSADVGNHGGGNDMDWIEWSVDWYNYNPGTGDHQNFRSGLIFSNYWGYENENLDPDYHNRTSSQLWVDLWFDRTNASTTVSGQINSMYYGMKEHGSAWWFGYGVFQPMKGEYENAMALDDLYDEGGNVTDSLKFDLMRVFVEVEKIAIEEGDDETWMIRAVENLNHKLADDRMQGIEQPSFEETLVLEMPMFQSMNPLVRAIDGIASAVWKGALGFQKILWSAMDSFFAWAGFGTGFFSRITAFLGAIPELFMKMMENIPIMIQNMVQLVEDIFGMVVRILPTFVTGIGYLTDSVMNYWTTLTAFFTGGLFPINIIQEIQLGDWIRAGFAMLPAWEMFSIIWADDSGKKLKERIDFYSGIFNGVINFVKGAIEFMQSFIQTIMDILPG